jgi:hypothetical protein
MSLDQIEIKPVPAFFSVCRPSTVNREVVICYPSEGTPHDFLSKFWILSCTYRLLFRFGHQLWGMVPPSQAAPPSAKHSTMNTENHRVLLAYHQRARPAVAILIDSPHKGSDRSKVLAAEKPARKYQEERIEYPYCVHIS